MTDKKWTEESLITEGYSIKNAKITSVDLSMANHGCLTLRLCLEGNGWGCVYGGYVLGHGYLGAKQFDGASNAIVSIMRIMDTVGVELFNDMHNKYVRVATKGWGGSVKIIGNIIADHWFDIESFFEENQA